jgi:flagellar biosynthetic protein FliQ
MDQLMAIDVGREAIWVLIRVAFPIMTAALVVGLVISLLQALTQIQEQTLVFVPKIITVFFVLLLFLPYIGHELKTFSEFLAERMVLVQTTSTPTSF